MSASHVSGSLKWLVTGGAGFIGSHFVRHVLKTRADVHIINLDLLTYAGNLENLSDLKNEKRHQFIRGDILDSKFLDEVVRGCDGIFNFAAESHVDRSILGPESFVQTNVVGTQRLLDAARKHGIRRFLQIS